jgi:hypothetical protein
MLGRIRRAFEAVGEGLVAGALWRIVVLPEIPSGPKLRYITVAAMIKNEGAYLEEWLDFHLGVGVEHFVLYDNGSSDNTRQVCDPYIRAGLVTLIPWANFSVWFNQQRGAYAHALANFGPSSFWMGFFDLDEFVFPVVDTSLVDVLRAREGLPVLAVAGVNFGTSGHRSRPADGVLRSYCMAVPMEVQRRHGILMDTKCFVQPCSIQAVVGLHRFRIKGDRANGYTEHGLPLQGCSADEPQKLTVEVIRYNHYFTRSQQEFTSKLHGTDARGPRWAAHSRYHKQEMFDLIEALGEKDYTIWRLLAAEAPAEQHSAAKQRAYA